MKSNASQRPNGVRRAYVLLAAVASAALVGLLAYGVVGAGGSTTMDDAVRAGKRPAAPSNVRLPRLSAPGLGSLEDFQGGPLIVNFWASWCDPCKEEAPLIERAHQRLRRAGGSVLGVTVSDASDDSVAFMRRYRLTFPSLRDVGGELGDALQTTGVPETFVVDRRGRILMISRGTVNQKFIDDAIRRVAR